MRIAVPVTRRDHKVAGRLDTLDEREAGRGLDRLITWAAVDSHGEGREGEERNASASRVEHKKNLQCVVLPRITAAILYTKYKICQE